MSYWMRNSTDAAMIMFDEFSGAAKLSLFSYCEVGW
jgi:hypothetical protein